MATSQPAAARATRSATDVAFLVHDGIVLLDLAGPVEVFSIANMFGGRYERRIITVGAESTVRTNIGVQLGVDGSLRDLRSGVDTLVVVGGPDLPALEPAVVEEVRTAALGARRVVSICTGAFILAAARLLDGREATTHWAFASTLAERYPLVDVQPDRIFVQDGHVWTSGGVTSGIDLALAIVEEDHGSAVARQVAKLMVVFLRRPGGQSQHATRSPAVRARSEPLRTAIDAVIAKPDADHSVAALAGRAGFSERQFTRVFRDETGTTPARFVETVRVEVAQGVLEAGDEALGVVARWVGFGSEETMRRAFLRQLGVTPGNLSGALSIGARERRARRGARAPVRAASRRVAGAITGRMRPVTGG